MNEDFTGDDTFQAPYDASNWPPSQTLSPLLLPSTGFYDGICIINVSNLLSPTPEPPQSPLTTSEVDYHTQAWFVGSSNSGQGIQVQTDTLQRYLDHGRHLNITSPTR